MDLSNMLIWNEKRFFREIAATLCGYESTEDSMLACLTLLRSYMPASALFLEHFDGELDSILFLVGVKLGNAKTDKKTIIDLPFPLSPEAMGVIRDYIDYYMNLPPEEPRVARIINRSEENLVSQEIMGYSDIPEFSILSLPLMSEGKLQGAMLLMAEGFDRYETEHADKFSILAPLFSVLLTSQLRQREVWRLKALLDEDDEFHRRELVHFGTNKIIGRDLGLAPTMELVERVAGLDSPVLLLGETGTGKDVVAHALHRSSARAEGPFIRVNCGAVPESLLDSELFGHEKGAFTGAEKQKRGRFERAQGGTIFLDEIGELSAPAQVRLLRVLQNREFERVGGSETLKADIRIIAATHRDLEEMVRAGDFREDLWFRLNVFPIQIPSLRNRKVDVPALLTYFMERKSRELKLSAIPSLSPESMPILMEYDWPGNVRELENMVERALILNPRGPLNFTELLSFDILQSPAPASEQSETESENLELVIANHVRRVLARANGKVSGSGGAAERLGVNPSTLRHRMRKLGIDY